MRKWKEQAVAILQLGLLQYTFDKYVSQDYFPKLYFLDRHYINLNKDSIYSTYRRYDFKSINLKFETEGMHELCEWYPTNFLGLQIKTVC